MPQKRHSESTHQMFWNLFQLELRHTRIRNRRNFQTWIRECFRHATRTQMRIRNDRIVLIERNCPPETARIFRGSENSGAAESQIGIRICCSSHGRATQVLCESDQCTRFNCPIRIPWFLDFPQDHAFRPIGIGPAATLAMVGA